MSRSRSLENKIRIQDGLKCQQALQKQLRYTFKNTKLLQQAITHRSYGATHNERLEFLGDSVLNFAVAALLFQRFSTLNEGNLSRMRANLVKQQSLYEIAYSLNLAKCVRVGEGEFKSGGCQRPSILADTLEAIVGAIYLDGGFDHALQVIEHLYAPTINHIDPNAVDKDANKDAKTLLQEYLQQRKIALPHYTVIATHGAAHHQQFEVECVVSEYNIRVFGAGASRRVAEQVAAKLALARVQKQKHRNIRISPISAKGGDK